MVDETSRLLGLDGLAGGALLWAAGWPGGRVVGRARMPDWPLLTRAQRRCLPAYPPLVEFHGVTITPYVDSLGVWRYCCGCGANQVRQAYWLLSQIMTSAVDGVIPVSPYRCTATPPARVGPAHSHRR